MFDYSMTHWVTFFSAALLLNLSPGPDLAYILAQTTRYGRRIGFLSMYGVWFGAFFHVFLTAVGLSAVLSASPEAFFVVKWMGGAYLFWLGIQAVLSSGGFAKASKKKRSKGSFFWQGVLIAALNPKVGLFFLAFLPQFVEPGVGSTSAQLLLHGTLVIGVAMIIEPLFLLAGDRLNDRMSRNPSITQWMDRGLGVLFIGLGVKLVSSEL